VACGIHLHKSTRAGGRDVETSQARRRFSEAPLVGFARLDQGLSSARGNPIAIASFDHAPAERARMAVRLEGQGRNCYRWRFSAETPENLLDTK